MNPDREPGVTRGSRTDVKDEGQSSWTVRGRIRRSRGVSVTEKDGRGEGDSTLGRDVELPTATSRDSEVVHRPRTVSHPRVTNGTPTFGGGRTGGSRVSNPDLGLESTSKEGLRENYEPGVHTGSLGETD